MSAPDASCCSGSSQREDAREQLLEALAWPAPHHHRYRALLDAFHGRDGSLPPLPKGSSPTNSRRRRPQAPALVLREAASTSRIRPRVAHHLGVQGEARAVCRGPSWPRWAVRRPNGPWTRWSACRRCDRRASDAVAEERLRALAQAGTAIAAGRLIERERDAVAWPCAAASGRGRPGAARRGAGVRRDAAAPRATRVGREALGVGRATTASVRSTRAATSRRRSSWSGLPPTRSRRSTRARHALLQTVVPLAAAPDRADPARARLGEEQQWRDGAALVSELAGVAESSYAATAASRRRSSTRRSRRKGAVFVVDEDLRVVAEL